MGTSGHQKHANIVKPLGGKFNKNEVALIGAPCSIIQSLARKLNEELKPLSVGFADADHNSDGSEDVFEVTYTNKITHHELKFNGENIEYGYRSLFNQVDLALINGNHFLGKNQIVIINQKKKDSLAKKLDRLSNVWFFILDEGEEELHDFLIEKNSQWAFLQKFKISEVGKIAGYIKNTLNWNKPQLKGLVLAGGKSTRMGFDKGTIDYHGKPQREHTADLLSNVCEETFISINKEIETNYPIINDTFLDLGPYGGILSAFRQDPNSAWFTVATDVPLLNESTLKELAEKRDLSKMATCFHNPETNFPEPLITIWEPRAYPQLLHFLTLGYSCARKALINSDIKEVQLENPVVLENANNPDEMAKLKSLIDG